MKLSIVIVNYNVKYFLEQCLYSVRKASANVTTEIWVVDNNSVDGSVEMVKEKFPEVHIIENKKNEGFSVANNQAIKLAQGEYILLLNPDTVVQEDTFEKVIRFMDEHPDAGGLGVKMIDGKGNFLPESKRGLPTPLVAFYKIFGLSKLFPQSRLFGRYHLGFLDKEKIHEVDVLAGAFMLMRKKTLDKVGMLDETFFMYGEDIDLSYRIQQGGYKNYYFPETQIIHYKGESTKKSSVNYVFVFYNAMIIFAKKHFSQKNANLFSFLINIAIYIRAGAAILNRFIKKLILPLMDVGIWYIGLYFIKIYWEHNHRYVRGPYPETLLEVAFPLYILGWLIPVILLGGYDKPYKLSKLVRGLLVGTLLISVVYGFLDESWRFSRALIILGAFWTVISSVALRLVLNVIGLKNFKLDAITSEKRIAIVATEDDGNRVKEMLKQANQKFNLIGFVHPEKIFRSSDDHYLGNVVQLKEVVEVYSIDEVIFSTKNIPLQEVINSMSTVNIPSVDYKIAPEDSLFIIGSNSVDNPGDLYTIDINFAIIKPTNQRNKFLFDIIISVLLLLASPVLIFIVKKPLQFFKNIFNVLIRKRSWVGYVNSVIDTKNLPVLKKGILNPVDGLPGHHEIDIPTAKRLNLLYAKHYQLENDALILWRGLKNLGRTN
jgi:O-antigen biosynthesis protein